MACGVLRLPSSCLNPHRRVCSWEIIFPSILSHGVRHTDVLDNITFHSYQLTTPLRSYDAQNQKIAGPGQRRSPNVSSYEHRANHRYWYIGSRFRGIFGEPGCGNSLTNLDAGTRRAPVPGRQVHSFATWRPQIKQRHCALRSI